MPEATQIVFKHKELGEPPVARDVLERVGALYHMEEQVRGKPRDERRAVRHRQSSRCSTLRQWFE
jgi:transposase